MIEMSAPYPRIPTPSQVCNRLFESCFSSLCVCVCQTKLSALFLSFPTALLYKPIDRVTRSTLVLHVSTHTWYSHEGFLICPETNDKIGLEGTTT